MNKDSIFTNEELKLFPNLLHPPLTCYSFALLTSFCSCCGLLSFDVVHNVYKVRKVGMSDMQEWTEEVLEPNKTSFLCFPLCMFKFYNRVRKQFLQL